MDRTTDFTRNARNARNTGIRAFRGLRVDGSGGT